MNNRSIPTQRHIDATRVAHNVLVAVIALGALICVPLFLSSQGGSDTAGDGHTVFLLFAGLAAAVGIGAVVIARTGFRERRGSGMTVAGRIAELEAQFESEGPGSTS